MKKLSLVLLILAISIMPAMVFANPPSTVQSDYNLHKGDTGEVWTVLPDGVNDQEIDRTGYYLDQNNENKDNFQSVSLKIDAHAYIPCYIEMNVRGNQGVAKAQSFGPKAQTDAFDRNFIILFDNEVGGFVDGAWKVLGHGKNAQIEPGSNVYIRGCDKFKVTVYSNDSFKYTVKAAALAPVDAIVTSAEAADLLPLQMRTDLGCTGNWGATDTFDTANDKIIELGSYLPCQSMSAMHEFRVPYARNIAHGEYKGEVKFYAYTF